MGRGYFSRKKNIRSATGTTMVMNLALRVSKTKRYENEPYQNETISLVFRGGEKGSYNVL